MSEMIKLDEMGKISTGRELSIDMNKVSEREGTGNTFARKKMYPKKYEYDE